MLNLASLCWGIWHDMVVSVVIVVNVIGGFIGSFILISFESFYESGSFVELFDLDGGPKRTTLVKFGILDK